MAGARLKFRKSSPFRRSRDGRTEFSRERTRARFVPRSIARFRPRGLGYECFRRRGARSEGDETQSVAPRGLGYECFRRRGARGKTSEIQSAAPARVGRRMYHCVRRAGIVSFEVFVFPTRGSGTPPPREARHLPGAPGRDAPLRRLRRHLPQRGRVSLCCDG